MLTAVVLLVLSCGSERWAQKTLTDDKAPLVHLEPIATTVEDLMKMPVPEKWLPDMPRMLSESESYKVSAWIVGYRAEADGDAHVVIAGRSGATMIAEFPAAECLDGSIVEGLANKAMADFLALVGRKPGKWRKLKKPLPVRISGVLFFDKIGHGHNPTGAAQSGAELHPVTAIEAL